MSQPTNKEAVIPEQAAIWQSPLTGPAEFRDLGPILLAQERVGSRGTTYGGRFITKIWPSSCAKVAKRVGKSCFALSLTRYRGATFDCGVSL